jgi:hypothetical protein
MSANGSSRGGLARRMRFRTIGPEDADPEAVSTCPTGERLDVARCRYRPPDADFYCWKFGVWYNLMDCCYRHVRRTYPGCADCGQGENNLRQNRDRYHAVHVHRQSPFAR